VTIAIGVFVFFYAAVFSKGGFSFAENPALYPRMLAVILVLLGASLLFQTRIKLQRSAADNTAPASGADEGVIPEGRPRVIRIAAALIGFVVMTWFVGFVVASVFFCFVTPLILGTTKKTAIIVSLALTGVIYLLFFIFFKVPVPHGIFFG
jgi:hypothetical protein